MIILITGGTGFIGTQFAKHLLVKNHSIIILTRNIDSVKLPVKAITDLNEIKSDENIDIIVNLAGASIFKSWTEDYKKTIFDSRINTTKDIVGLIKRLERKPKLLISASATGYYGEGGDALLDEESDFSNAFTHGICEKWEHSAMQAEEFGVRLCIARLGVVLGKTGGAIKRMLPPFKLGLGGRLGSGKQYFSWVHIDDVVKAFDFFIEDKTAKGVYNLTSPKPVTNQEFTKSIGKAIKRPTIFPVPEFMVKAIFGEMGKELFLVSERAIPKKLSEEGFKFNYPEIDAALNEMISQ